MDEVSNTAGGVSRRTMIKGAAWSVPVIAVAAATPLAAASTNNATIAWTGGASTLLTLNVFDAGDTVSASVLPSAPTVIGIQNGAGAIPNVTFTVATVQNPGLGVAVGLGTRTMRGYAPSSITGTTASSLTRTPRTLGSVGLTTFVATDTSRTFTIGNIAANANLSLPVTWGTTAPNWSGVGVASVSLLTSFSVTVTFYSNGVEFKQLTTPGISIPAVAGLL